MTRPCFLWTTTTMSMMMGRVMGLGLNQTTGMKTSASVWATHVGSADAHGIGPTE